MARNFRPVDRDTLMLLPPDMRHWLPADHLAWLVIEVVESLDLQAIRREYKLGSTGREAYDPAMLTSLLIYAYCVGERSSRQIEKACVTDVAFRVLSAQQAPDHCTISRFRARHSSALADLFGQVLRVCAEAGLGRVGIVSVDGTKIAANASPRRNYSEDSLARKAAGIIAEAQQVDAAEDAEHGPARGDELPEQLRAGPDRAARIRRALADLDTAETGQDALFDHPEAAPTELAAGHGAQQDDDQQDGGRDAGPFGPARRGGHTAPPRAGSAAARRGRAARAQRIVDALDGIEAQHAGVIAADVTAAETALARAVVTVGNKRAIALRRHAMHPAQTRRRPVDEHVMVRNAEDYLARCQVALAEAKAGRGRRAAKARDRGKKVRRNGTDADSRLLPGKNAGGFVQGYNAQFVVSDDHLILATGVSVKSNDVEQFIPMLQAAAGGVEALGRGETIGVVLADSGYCSAQNITAAGPDRLIAVGRDPAVKKTSGSVPPPVTEMGERLAQGTKGRALYARRGATVEPVIGQVLERVGLRRFARRGMQAVRDELSLAALAHNVRRLAVMRAV